MTLNNSIFYGIQADQVDEKAISKQALNTLNF